MFSREVTRVQSEALSSPLHWTCDLTVALLYLLLYFSLSRLGGGASNEETPKKKKLGALRATLEQIPYGKTMDDEVLALTLILPHDPGCPGLSNAADLSTAPAGVPSAAAPAADTREPKREEARDDDIDVSPSKGQTSNVARSDSAHPAKKSKPARANFRAQQLFEMMQPAFEQDACSWSVSNLRRRISEIDKNSAKRASHVMRLLRQVNECSSADSARQIQGFARKLTESGFGVALHTGDAAAVRAQILAAAQKLYISRVRNPKVGAFSYAIYLSASVIRFIPQLTCVSTRGDVGRYAEVGEKRTVHDRRTNPKPEKRRVREANECSYCEKPARVMCARCGTPYCTRECQRVAWPIHKLFCVERPHG